jgi:hypothetical protein
MRQLGTVLGIAVLGSVFSATGGLGSPVEFTTGLTAALTVSAAVLGASALVVLLAPDARQAQPAHSARPARREVGGVPAPAIARIEPSPAPASQANAAANMPGS